MPRFKVITPILVVTFISLSLLTCISGCTFHSSSSDRLSKAESLSRENKFEEAIALYREHMSERLSEKDKPEWENPYFYLLLIGDLQLRQGKFDESVNSYLEAEKEKVDSSLISDRLRSVAKAYEDKGEIEKAIQFLTNYRDKDPLLIDSVLDRLARKLVEMGAGTSMIPPFEPTP